MASGGDMRRREFLGVLGSAAAWPAGTKAQPQGRLRRIGFLASGLGDDEYGKNIAGAFLQGLGALGWREAVNLHIDWRWYGVDATVAAREATELMALKPEVFLAGGNIALENIRRQTSMVPIVFALVSDPVGMGYVNGLARPGGNITGFSSYDPPIYTKQLQMFAEITPRADTVAFLYS